MGEVAPFDKPPFVGEKVKLGELISKAAVKRCGEESYPVLSMTMHDGIIEQRDRFKKAIASKDTSAYKVVNPGQLVVGFPIDEGVIYVQNYEFPGIMSPAYNVWDIDNSKVNPSYLELALHSPNSMAYYTDKMRGTTARRRSITADNLCALEIPLPSLDEQAETLAVFEEVKSAQSACSAYVDKLDQLVKSRFVEMFGDDSAFKKCDMSQLVKGIVSGTNIGGNQRLLEPGEFAVLRISAVTKGWFNSAEYKVVDDVSSIDMIHPRKGDLLFSRANTSEMVGATAIVDKDYENLFLPDKLWRLDLADDVNTVFVKYLLSTQAVRKEMSKVATGSSGSMQNISMAKFRKLKAFLPPLALQQEFADFVAQVDKPRFAVQQQIDKLQMLYDSLAQEYFGD